MKKRIFFIISLVMLLSSCANFLTKELDAPANVSALVSGTTVTLSWAVVEDATYYKVYYSSSVSGPFYAYDNTVTTNGAVITDETSGDHYYKVQACNDSLQSGLSSYAYAYVIDGLSTPTNVTATASGTTVTLSWTSVTNATYYRVYYATTSSGTYTEFDNTVTTAGATISDVTSGAHYYKVRACNSSSQSELSSSAYVYVGLLAPANVTATASGTTVTLSWTSVTNATYYRVYYATTSSGTYTEFSDTVTTAGATISSVTSGAHYYKVRACNSSTQSEMSSYAYVYVSNSYTYGNYSQIPSGATLLTIDNKNNTKNVYQTDYISSSGTKYYYFYATAGTTYYFNFYDKYCCSSQLTTWGYSTQADIKVAGCFSGAESALTSSDYIDGTISSTSYGSAYATPSHSGYYVLIVKPYNSSAYGYYGIRVSTTM